MKCLLTILAVLIALTGLMFASWLDTGMIECQQPNGVRFIARLWGDEFFHWMETQEGYRIVRGPDKYFIMLF